VRDLTRGCCKTCPGCRRIRGIFVSRLCKLRALTLLGLLAPNPRQGRTPCTCFGRLRRPRMGVRTGVCRDYSCARFFGRSVILFNALFLSDATPFARLRAAVFRKDRFPRQTVCNFRKAGDFAEPFPPPLRELLCPRRFSLRRAPQGVAHPLIRGRAKPCTCPAPPFTAKPGLCFTRQFAAETPAFVNNGTISSSRSVEENRKKQIFYLFQTG